MTGSAVLIKAPFLCRSTTQSRFSRRTLSRRPSRGWSASTRSAVGTTRESSTSWHHSRLGMRRSADDGYWPASAATGGGRFVRLGALGAYYLAGSHLPDLAFPGGRIFNAFRCFLLRLIVPHFGHGNEI